MSTDEAPLRGLCSYWDSSFSHTLLVFQGVRGTLPGVEEFDCGEFLGQILFLESPI